jgi:transcriptional regulator with XRE-family HTH domain
MNVVAWSMASVAKAPLPKETSRSEVGKRLGYLRSVYGLSAADLCKQQEIQANAYSQWESGARLINLADAIRIASAYSATLDYIYRGSKEGLPYNTAQKILLEEAKSGELFLGGNSELRRSAPKRRVSREDRKRDVA